MNFPSVVVAGLTRYGGAALLLVTTGAALCFGDRRFGEIVSSFEFPIPPCRGIAYDGEYIWGYEDDSYVAYRLTTSGSIVSSFEFWHPGSPFESAYGAEYDGEYLWFSIFDVQIWKVFTTRFTTDGVNVGGFSFGSFFFDAGLAWETPYLWVANRKYTTTGSLVSYFPYHPHVGLGDTAFVGHYIWTSGVEPTRLYQRTTDGSTVGSWEIPPLTFPIGKAFDGNYLWLFDAPSGWCYQVDIGVVAVEPSSLGKIKALYR